MSRRTSSIFADYLEFYILRFVLDFLSNLADTHSTRQDQLDSEQELPQKEEASQPKRVSYPRKACGAMLAAAQNY